MSRRLAGQDFAVSSVRRLREREMIGGKEPSGATRCEKGKCRKGRHRKLNLGLMEFEVFH